jgi:hypothetical protein
MIGAYNKGLPYSKTSKSEDGLGKCESNFFVSEIHGVVLHPTNNVSNICVSLHDHDIILPPSR